VRRRSLAVRLGGFACRRLLTLNRLVHWLHDVCDRPYWSLAQHVKARFPGAQAYIDRYRNATLAAAREAGVDGVVCGHIHRAAFTEVDGLLYCNDGDWVESCTALVEDEAGELELVQWRPTAATIKARVRIHAAVPETALDLTGS
jgi:UDP-2,3-diacylglucosamine pyrophosphatase LpxH